MVFALYTFGTAYFLSLGTTVVYVWTGSLGWEAALTILIMALVIAVAAFGLVYFLLTSVFTAGLLLYVLRQA